MESIFIQATFSLIIYLVYNDIHTTATCTVFTVWLCDFFGSFPCFFLCSGDPDTHFSLNQVAKPLVVKQTSDWRVSLRVPISKAHQTSAK